VSTNGSLELLNFNFGSPKRSELHYSFFLRSNMPQEIAAMHLNVDIVTSDCCQTCGNFSFNLEYCHYEGGPIPLVTFHCYCQCYIWQFPLISHLLHPDSATWQEAVNFVADTELLARALAEACARYPEERMTYAHKLNIFMRGSAIPSIADFMQEYSAIHERYKTSCVPALALAENHNSPSWRSASFVGIAIAATRDLEVVSPAEDSADPAEDGEETEDGGDTEEESDATEDTLDEGEEV